MTLRWQCGGRVLTFERPRLMGVLNVTPDSFSDGGAFFAPDAAIARGRELFAQGADVVDVGGESSRPGAAPVEEAEELRRILPVLHGLGPQAPGLLSADTRKPAVARAALEAGAAVVNDITGLQNPEMRALVAKSGAGAIIMHMQGEPQTMQLRPHYEDVTAEVATWLASQIELCEGSGISREQLAVDPGIGFGKTAAHNLALLHNLGQIAALGRPVVVGASRKSFIGEVTGLAVGERLPGSLAALAIAAWNGAHLLRVHEVRESRAALELVQAVQQGGGRPPTHPIPPEHRR